MIDMLIDDDLNRFFDRDDMADYLSYLLRTGIKGYDSYSDQDLENEIFDRSLTGIVDHG